MGLNLKMKLQSLVYACSIYIVNGYLFTTLHLPKDSLGLAVIQRQKKTGFLFLLALASSSGSLWSVAGATKVDARTWDGLTAPSVASDGIDASFDDAMAFL